MNPVREQHYGVQFNTFIKPKCMSRKCPNVQATTKSTTYERVVPVATSMWRRHAAVVEGNNTTSTMRSSARIDMIHKSRRTTKRILLSELDNEESGLAQQQVVTRVEPKNCSSNRITMIRKKDRADYSLLLPAVVVNDDNDVNSMMTLLPPTKRQRKCFDDDDDGNKLHHHRTEYDVPKSLGYLSLFLEASQQNK